MARGLGPSGLARAPHERGGVKKRGTFPIWVRRHLCQQFQSQQLTVKTASTAEREYIYHSACGTVLRAEPFCARNRSACGTVLLAKPFCARNRSACGTVLRAEPFCMRNEMEPKKQASIYR